MSPPALAFLGVALTAVAGVIGALTSRKSMNAVAAKTVSEVYGGLVDELQAQLERQRQDCDLELRKTKAACEFRIAALEAHVATLEERVRAHIQDQVDPPES